MKKIYSLFVALFAAITISAQTATIQENYAILTSGVNGTPQFYDLQATTANLDFNGANLGIFHVNSSLVINGGQNKTRKCENADITGGTMYYRIRSNNANVPFSSINLPWKSDDGASGDCKDQTWEGQSGTANIISGLAPGKYSIDIYTTATTNFGSNVVTVDNNGNFYTATFEVTDVLGVADFEGLAKKSVVAQGKLFTAQRGTLDIQVFDFSGKVVKTLKVNSNGNPVDINLQQKGLYLMKISNGHESEVVKFSY